MKMLGNPPTICRKSTILTWFFGPPFDAWWPMETGEFNQWEKPPLTCRCLCCAILYVASRVTRRDRHTENTWRSDAMEDIYLFFSDTENTCDTGRQREREREREGGRGWVVHTLRAIHEHISAFFIESFLQTFTTSPHSYVHTLLLHSHIIIHSCSAIPWNREKKRLCNNRTSHHVCVYNFVFTTTSTRPKNAVLYAADWWLERLL